jgi:TatA/E family protein of Tat protein translocase
VRVPTFNCTKDKKTMFGHPLELIIVLVLALIFFGPEKLPEVAASAGKFVRDLREAFDAAANPEETILPDDFSTYYYESMSHSDEEVVSEEDNVPVEEMPDPADGAVDYAHTGAEWDPALHPTGSHPWDTNRLQYESDDLVDPAAGPVSHDARAGRDEPEAV